MQPVPDALITRPPTTQLELVQCFREQEVRFRQLAAEFAAAVQTRLDESERENRQLAERVTLLDHALQEEQAHTAATVAACENRIAVLTTAHATQSATLQAQITGLSHQHQQTANDLNHVTHQLTLEQLGRERDRNEREILALCTIFYETRERYETLRGEYERLQQDQMGACAVGSLVGAAAGPVGVVVGGLASTVLGHVYFGGREEVPRYRQLVRMRDEAEEIRRELGQRAPNKSLPSLSNLPVAPKGYS